MKLTSNLYNNLFMKWIKSSERFPDKMEMYCTRKLLSSGRLFKAGVVFNPKDDVMREVWLENNTEWLDESINQDVSDVNVGNIGSLKDSDWKAVYDILKESDVCFSSDCDKVGECTHTGHGCSEWERYSKRIWNEVIAPLLQNELKGDDLESSNKSLGNGIGDAVRSSALTQIEQINYVDAEDWLWSFMQDWQDYKNENQSRWVAYRIFFKEFIQKKQAKQ